MITGFHGRMGKCKTKRSLGNLHLFNASRSFPSSKTLTFKISQGKKLSSENEFLLHDYRNNQTMEDWILARDPVFGGKLSRPPTPFNRSNKENHFHIKDFAVNQVLKLRHKEPTKKAGYFK